MSEPIYSDLSTISDATRVRLLRLLEAEELGVGELTRILHVPQSTVSRHLKTLLTQHWVQRRSDGPANYFRFTPESLLPAARRLWTVVRDETDALYAEDSRRLQSLLALRSADSREFFRRNAGSWEALRTDLYGGGFVLPTLLQLLPPGLVVADLGCGTGEAVAALAPVVREVVGIDREQAMLDAAALRTQGHDNVRLELGGLDALPLADATLDAALSSLVFQHVPDLGAAVCEVARTLKPGGSLLVLDLQPHDRADLLRTLGHQHAGFSADDLSRLGADAGLVLETWRPLPESPGALGPALFLSRLSRPSN